MKLSKWIVGLILLGIVAIGIFWGRGRARGDETSTMAFTLGNGLFCWEADALDEEKQEALFQLMEEQGLTALYQYIPSDAEKKKVRQFLEAASGRGLEVWLLTGAPEWGLDETGEAMIEQVERTVVYNVTLPEKSRIKGILMDCEPYLLEEWDGRADQIMQSWNGAMQQGRLAANQEGLLFLACIPYYLDTKGFLDALQALIEENCDGLAIMNYYKKDEKGHIETEVELARAAKKPVTVIYELQPPGEYGLQEINTYYGDGLPALQKSWQNIIEGIGGEGLSYAMHEYESLREMLGHG